MSRIAENLGSYRESGALIVITDDLKTATDGEFIYPVQSGLSGVVCLVTCTFPIGGTDSSKGDCHVTSVSVNAASLWLIQMHGIRVVRE